MTRVVLFAIFVIFISCDRKKIVEEYKDIPNHSWAVSDTIRFPVTVEHSDTVTFYCYIRNNLDYPFSRIFIHYIICDSAGHELGKAMKERYLFDAKTGEPSGQSGIGDIFDHQLLLQKLKVAKGRYQLKISHKMRDDVLSGIWAIGIRVEGNN